MSVFYLLIQDFISADYFLYKLYCKYFYPNTISTD